MNDAETAKKYKKYMSLVYYIAGSKAKQPSDADDIVQEVFLRFVSKKPKFNNEEHARAWFIRVTFNVIKSYYKSAYFVRKVEMEQEDYENVESDDDFMSDIENSVTFSGRLDRLSPECKVVMLLRFGYGYAIKEIADMTGYKTDRVKALLVRGKREYRGILQRETGEDMGTSAAVRAAAKEETI